MSASFGILAEVDASLMFRDESLAWEWCTVRATFAHRDASVCEFVVHLYNHADDRDAKERNASFRALLSDLHDHVARRLKELGVTDLGRRGRAEAKRARWLAKALTDARRAGATHCLLYV